MTNFQCQLQNNLLPRLARLPVEAKHEAIADDLLQIRRLNHGELGQKSAWGKRPNRDCREARFWIAFGFPTIQGDIANFIKTFTGASGPIPSATRSIRWALTG